MPSLIQLDLQGTPEAEAAATGGIALIFSPVLGWTFVSSLGHAAVICLMLVLFHPSTHADLETEVDWSQAHVIRLELIPLRVYPYVPKTNGSVVQAPQLKRAPGVPATRKDPLAGFQPAVRTAAVTAPLATGEAKTPKGLKKLAKVEIWRRTQTPPDLPMKTLAGATRLITKTNVVRLGVEPDNLERAAARSKQAGFPGLSKLPAPKLEKQVTPLDIAAKVGAAPSITMESQSAASLAPLPATGHTAVSAPAPDLSPGPPLPGDMRDRGELLAMLSNGSGAFGVPGLPGGVTLPAGGAAFAGLGLGSPAGRTGSGHGLAVVGSGDASSGAAETHGIIHITRSKDGLNDVVILQGDDPDNDVGKYLSGSQIYSVYVPAGEGHKEWTISFCMPPGRGDVKILGPIISLQAPAPLKAPYAYSITVPQNIDFQNDSKSVLIHGFLTTDGKFEKLNEEGTPSLMNLQDIIAALEKWELRPAMQDNVAVPVEVLISVPNPNAGAR